MAQQVKVLAAKPQNLGSIPGTYMIKRENQLLQVGRSGKLSFDLHTCGGPTSTKTPFAGLGARDFRNISKEYKDVCENNKTKHRIVLGGSSNLVNTEVAHV